MDKQISNNRHSIHPGTAKSDIFTPALVIDLRLLESNLATMAGFFRGQSASLRPHFKTHKSPEIARRQLTQGAIGITCAKLGEAEVLAEARVPSILIANEVVDARKIYRLAELARQTQIIVAVDQAENLKQISDAARAARSELHVLVEVNVGMNRCGVQTVEAALDLARQAVDLSGVAFKGVMGYEGHTISELDPTRRFSNVQNAMGMLVSTAERIRQAGIPVEIVSAGGTGTYDMTGSYPGVTEVQAGSYVFMDTHYSRMDLAFKSALTLMATVISRQSPRCAVMDAGMKVLSSDHGLPEVLSPRGVKLAALHEEHGVLEFESGLVDLRVGDQVELLPSHACTTVNLHDYFYILQNGLLVDKWEIAGRGKSQ